MVLAGLDGVAAATDHVGRSSTTAIPALLAGVPPTAGSSPSAAPPLLRLDGRPVALNQPIVGMAATPTGGGYWHGGLRRRASSRFGDAAFYGSTGGHRTSTSPSSGMAADPATGGYWVVASDGGHLHLRRRRFFGSMGGRTSTSPSSAWRPPPTAGATGWWPRTAGIFAFGDAQFYGSTGSDDAEQADRRHDRHPRRQGYWSWWPRRRHVRLRDAPFYGSLGGDAAEDGRSSAVSATPSTTRLLVHRQQRRGHRVRHGRLLRLGPPGAQRLRWWAWPRPPATAVLGATPFQSGSYGYDVSNYQCTGFPPHPHAIGVVEATGCVDRAPTRAWPRRRPGPAAGSTSTSSSRTAQQPSRAAHSRRPHRAQLRLRAGQDAFKRPETAGVNTRGRPGGSTSRTPAELDDDNLADNASVVQGASLALTGRGPEQRRHLRQPRGLDDDRRHTSRVPYWAADWASQPGNSVQPSVRANYADVPSGPVAMVQYSSTPSYPYAAGGMDTAFDNDYAC